MMGKKGWCALLVGKSVKTSDTAEKFSMCPPGGRMFLAEEEESVKARTGKCLLCLSQAQCARR